MIATLDMVAIHRNMIRYVLSGVDELRSEFFQRFPDHEMR